MYVPRYVLMSYNPQIQFYPLFPDDRLISAQVLKLKDYAILINAGIAPPYYKYLASYQTILPNIYAVLLTNSSLYCCGALPWLKSLGYKGQFFIPQFLLAQISTNVQLMRSSAFLDYYNYIPDDEYVKPLVNSQTLFSMEQKRDLYLDTYIVMYQGVSVQVKQYAIDSAALLFRTDYFVENLFVCSEFYKNSVHRIDYSLHTEKDSRIYLCCFYPTNRVKRLYLSDRDIIKQTLSCMQQNVYVVCFSDGVNGFYQLFYQLIYYINEINTIMHLKVSLICADADRKALLENKIILQYFSENRIYNARLPSFGFSSTFDNANIMFVLDCTFMTGYSRVFALSQLAQSPSVKILVGDVGVRYIENQAIVSLVKAKLTRRDVQLQTYEFAVSIVDEQKARTMRDELNLAPFELLVEDITQEQVSSKMDLLQLLDFSTCIDQFTNLDEISRDPEIKLAANRKTLIFVPEQKHFIVDFLTGKRVPGLPLSNYFSTVLTPDSCSIMDMIELDQFKNYRVQFYFDKNKPDFQKSEFQCLIIKYFLEILFDKRMIERTKDGVVFVPESRQQNVVSKTKNATALVPIFRNYIDNQPITFYRSADDIEIGYANYMDIQRKKATAQTQVVNVTFKCYIDILEFDYYHDLKTGCELLYRICFGRRGVIDPSDAYLQEMGSGEKYIVTQFSRRIVYEMQNITHVVKLRFAPDTKVLRASYGDDAQYMLKYMGEVHLDGETVCAQGSSHFTDIPVQRELFCKEATLNELLAVIDGCKLKPVAGFAYGQHFKSEYCDVFIKMNDTKQKVEELEVYGREGREIEELSMILGYKCGVWCDI